MPSIEDRDRAQASPLRNPLPNAQRWLYALWKFSRPHTIIGTSLSVLGLFLIAWGSTSHSAYSIGDGLLAVGALVACLCGNLYIVGLNQLEDVAIDRINKPHLPLASGEFSLMQGRWLVGTAGVLALVLAWLQGGFLLATVGISLVIGTAYSLPPIRLKRWAFWASVCILTVRGAVVNLGLFAHFQQAFCSASADCAVAIPASIWALTLFVVGFTFAIAIFKDIPDMEGDRHYNISTFTLRLGASAVLQLAQWVLTICYLGLIVAGFVWLPGVNPWVLALSHGVALLALWWRSYQLDLTDRSAIAACYQFIWKLFFLEYLMFPLACLSA